MEKDLLRRLMDTYVDIQFFEKEHIYFNKGKQLISTTSLIKLFEQPFNKDYWLKIKSEEQGITVKELEDIWEAKKEAGISRGKYLHNYIENALQRKYDNNVICELKRQALSFVDKFYAHHIVSELVIGNDIIGGMIDNLSLIDGKLYIVDYKTDKKFTEDSNYYYLPPISHLSKCEFNKYSLQTSIYRMLLEERGFKVEGQIIFWFNEYNDDYKQINCKYLKEECQQLINTYQHSGSS